MAFPRLETIMLDGWSGDHCKMWKGLHNVSKNMGSGNGCPKLKTLTTFNEKEVLFYEELMGAVLNALRCRASQGHRLEELDIHIVFRKTSQRGAQAYYINMLREIERLVDVFWYRGSLSTSF